MKNAFNGLIGVGVAFLVLGASGRMVFLALGIVFIAVGLARRKRVAR